MMGKRETRRPCHDHQACAELDAEMHEFYRHAGELARGGPLRPGWANVSYSTVLKTGFGCVDPPVRDLEPPFVGVGRCWQNAAPSSSRLKRVLRSAVSQAALVVTWLPAMPTDTDSRALAAARPLVDTWVAMTRLMAVSLAPEIAVDLWSSGSESDAGKCDLDSSSEEGKTDESVATVLRSPSPAPGTAGGGVNLAVDLSGGTGILGCDFLPPVLGELPGPATGDDGDRGFRLPINAYLPRAPAPVPLDCRTAAQVSTLNLLALEERRSNQGRIRAAERDTLLAQLNAADGEWPRMVAAILTAQSALVDALYSTPFVCALVRQYARVLEVGTTWLVAGRLARSRGEACRSCFASWYATGPPDADRYEHERVESGERWLAACSAFGLTGWHTERSVGLGQSWLRDSCTCIVGEVGDHLATDCNTFYYEYVIVTTDAQQVKRLGPVVWQFLADMIGAAADVSMGRFVEHRTIGSINAAYTLVKGITEAAGIGVDGPLCVCDRAGQHAAFVCDNEVGEYSTDMHSHTTLAAAFVDGWQQDCLEADADQENGEQMSLLSLLPYIADPITRRNTVWRMGAVGIGISIAAGNDQTLARSQAHTHLWTLFDARHAAALRWALRVLERGFAMPLPEPGPVEVFGLDTVAALRLFDMHAATCVTHRLVRPHGIARECPAAIDVKIPSRLSRALATSPDSPYVDNIRLVLYVLGAIPEIAVSAAARGLPRAALSRWITELAEWAAVALLKTGHHADGALLYDGTCSVLMDMAVGFWRWSPLAIG